MTRQNFFGAISGLFLVISVALFRLHQYTPAYDYGVMEVGNILMALLSISAWLLVNRNLHEKTDAFIRGVYSASLLKLMVCMFSILFFVFLNRSHIHKPTIFVLFGIYAVYTIFETIVLSKLVRDKRK